MRKVDILKPLVWHNENIASDIVLTKPMTESNSSGRNVKFVLTVAPCIP